MNQKVGIGVGVVGVFLLLAAGFVAQGVGGVSIRAVREGAQAAFVVSEPVVRGVPTRVRWEAIPEAYRGGAFLALRTTTGEAIVGRANATAGSLTVVFPCDISAPVSVVLRSSDGQVLAQKLVEVLPPGEDCLLERGQ